MIKTWMAVYGITVLATIASDVAVTLRANEIRRENNLKEMSYMPPLGDILLYFIPIYNLVLFFAYGFALFFGSDKEFLEIMEEQSKHE